MNSLLHEFTDCELETELVRRKHEAENSTKFGDFNFLIVDSKQGIKLSNGKYYTILYKKEVENLVGFLEYFQNLPRERA